MITQDSDYSVNSTVKDLFYSKIGVGDQYILMATGQYRIDGYIYSAGQVKQYTFTRSGTGYYNNWTCSVSDGDGRFTYSDEFEVYSNVGVGIMEDLPIYAATPAYMQTGLMALIIILVVLGGVWQCVYRIGRRS